VQPEAKTVIYNVLMSAILEIRSASESGANDANREFVNLLAHLVHNWPER
jgi:hypothetical protein